VTSIAAVDSRGQEGNLRMELNSKEREKRKINGVLDIDDIIEPLWWLCWAFYFWAKLWEN
jgi:hypothetical protein